MALPDTLKADNIISRLPLPASGLMLGIAALGALLESYWGMAKVICGVVAAVLFILLICKITVRPKKFVLAMRTPVTASVMGTFSMACMMLATYLEDYMSRGRIVWYIGIGMQVLVVLYFTSVFIVRFQFRRAYASYFIVYSGIAMISATAPKFMQESLGAWVIWLSILPVCCLLPILGIRYGKYKEVKEKFKPLFCVFAAPVNLCFVGYMRCVEKKSAMVIWGLWLTGLCLYVVVLWHLPGLLRLPFYPSCAAFTFPFVVTATATETLTVYMNQIGYAPNILYALLYIQIFIAVILVLYALKKYFMYVVTEKA